MILRFVTDWDRRLSVSGHQQRSASIRVPVLLRSGTNSNFQWTDIKIFGSLYTAQSLESKADFIHCAKRFSQTQRERGWQERICKMEGKDNLLVYKEEQVSFWGSTFAQIIISAKLEKVQSWGGINGVMIHTLSKFQDKYQVTHFMI